MTCAHAAISVNAGLNPEWSNPGPPCSNRSVGTSRITAPSGRSFSPSTSKNSFTSLTRTYMESAQDFGVRRYRAIRRFLTGLSRLDEMSIVIMQSAWAGLTRHDLDSNIDSSNYPCSDPQCSFESVNEQRRVPARGDQVWSLLSSASGRRPHDSRT